MGGRGSAGSATKQTPAKFRIGQEVIAINTRQLRRKVIYTRTRMEIASEPIRRKNSDGTSETFYKLRKPGSTGKGNLIRSQDSLKPL